MASYFKLIMSKPELSTFLIKLPLDSMDGLGDYAKLNKPPKNDFAYLTFYNGDICS